MVGAIVGSTKREPTVVGKPSDFMLDNIAKTFNLRREQICMVRPACVGERRRYGTATDGGLSLAACARCVCS